MKSLAFLSRKTSAHLAATAFLTVIAALGAGQARAQEPPAAADAGVPDLPIARTPNPFADRFPNVVLKTHEGRNVRFYDDLLKGKIVVINFMYATCTER